MPGGYEGAASGSSSSTASNSGAIQVKGGGVQFTIADKGATATGSSSTKTLLLIVSLVVGVALVGFVIWKLTKK